VSKFKERDRNTIKVYLAVLRLPSVDSDIIMHYKYSRHPYPLRPCRRAVRSQDCRLALRPSRLSTQFSLFALGA
jgi:hypothetical protein